MVAVGIAEAALLLAQHAFEQAHAVEQGQAALVQHRGEHCAGGIGLVGPHLAQGQARAAARDVVPVESIGRLERDHRLLTLSVVEGAEEAGAGVGDALSCIDRLGAGGAERQERRGRQHGPPGRRAVVMVVIGLVVGMPAVVRHGRSVRSRSWGTSACSRRLGSMRRPPACRTESGPAPRGHTASPWECPRRSPRESSRCRPCRPGCRWHR